MPKTVLERATSFFIRLFFFAAIFLSFRLLFPFYLAFFTVALVSFAANRLQGYTRLSPKALRLILLGVSIALIFCLTTSAVRTVLRESEGFLSSLYDTVTTVARAVLRFIERVKSRFHLGELISEEQLSEALSEIFTSITSSLSARLAAFAASFVKALPRFLIATVAYLFSTVYIALDYENVTAHLGKIIPKSVKPTLKTLKNASLSLLKHTLRAYGILFLITFAIVTVAFFLLKIDYPIWWALLTAGLDALPAIGIGIVLIPWGIGLLAAKRTVQGILMLCLYLGITLLRQALEPRILGRELGVPPLVSLVALYLGFKLFGGWGLLFSPVLAVLITRFVFKKQEVIL